MRAALLTALLLLAVFAAPALAGGPPGAGGTVISGGDLPHPVRLSGADEDAFVRRIGPPPRFDEAPRVSGPAYRIASAYWDAAVRGTREDKPPAEAAASYYPEGGLVKARQNGKDVWLVLDLRQRAIADRYIRLTQAGLLDEEPGLLDVLRAAAATEQVSVSIGGRYLDDGQRQHFWDLTQPLQERRDPKPGTADRLQPSQPRATWTSIVFGLYEGRSSSLLYALDAGLLVDSIGGEVYRVPEGWLVPLLGPAAAPGPDFDLQPAHIEQQEGTGAPFWWPLMIGGGLAALGAAYILNRRAVRRDV